MTIDPTKISVPDMGIDMSFLESLVDDPQSVAGWLDFLAGNDPLCSATYDYCKTKGLDELSAMKIMVCMYAKQLAYLRTHMYSDLDVSI